MRSIERTRKNIVLMSRRYPFLYDFRDTKTSTYPNGKGDDNRKRTFRSRVMILYDDSFDLVFKTRGTSRVRDMSEVLF